MKNDLENWPFDSWMHIVVSKQAVLKAKEYSLAQVVGFKYVFSHILENSIKAVS